MLLNGVYFCFSFQIGYILLYIYYLPRLITKCYSVLIKVLETKYNSINIIIAFFRQILNSSNYKNIVYIL